jgi:hypothetical protein
MDKAASGCENRWRAMAMLIEVQYPGGERVVATGYWGFELVVQIVPRGPEAAQGDVLAVDCTGASADLGAANPPRVVRVIGGPRRPTLRVQLPGLDTAARERWMSAREADGWESRDADVTAATPTRDRDEVWVVATRDGMDVAELERSGAVVQGGR